MANMSDIIVLTLQDEIKERRAYSALSIQNYIQDNKEFSAQSIENPLYLLTTGYPKLSATWVSLNRLQQLPVRTQDCTEDSQSQ